MDVLVANVGVEGRRKDHCAWLKLFSIYAAEITSCRASKPLLRNLCHWILSYTQLYDWIGETGSQPGHGLQLRVGECPDEGVEDHLSTYVRTIYLEEDVYRHGVVIMASMVAAIKTREQNPTGIFATLIQHGRSQLLTEGQLLASICRQLLSSRPQLVSELRYLFDEAQTALRGQNTAWSTGVLWRCLKNLLRSRNIGQMFLIIHQPDDPRLAAPFETLNDHLEKFLARTEVPCKVITLRRLSQETAGTPTPQKPGDYTIKLADEGGIPAAQLDLEAELDTVSQTAHYHISSDLQSVESSAGGPHPVLSVTRRILPLRSSIERLDIAFDFLHPLLGINKEKRLPILGRDVGAHRQQLTAGLLWIYHAMRPLSLSEVDEVLSIHRNVPDDEIIYDISAHEFAGMLPGIVGVEDGNVVLWRPDLVERFALSERIQSSGGKSRESEIPAPQDQQNFEANLAISHTCASCLLGYNRALKSSHESLTTDTAPLDNDGQSEKSLRRTSRSSESTVESPLLQYAVEYWFTHIQQSSQPSELDAGIFAQLLEDEDCVNLWLRLRESYRAMDSRACPRVSPVSLDKVKSNLGITTPKAIELLLQATSIEVWRSQKEDDWINVAIAAAQQGDQDTLSIMLSRGHLSNEATLLSVFEFGTDEALCHLLQQTEVKEIVRDSNNIHKVLCDAVRRGNSRLMEMAMTEFTHQLKLNTYRRPLLQISASVQVTLPPTLLEAQKPFIDYKDDQRHGGLSPLHLAAMSGDTNLVTWLLEFSPDSAKTVDQRDSHHASALLLAARSEHVSVVRQLLEAGADVSTKDVNSQTPLHEAAANGNSGIVTILLRYGADISSRNSQDKIPLHLALESSHPVVALQLLDSALSLQQSQETNQFNCDAIDVNGNSPMILAIEWEQQAVVRALVDHGADVALVGPRGRTALHIAARFGQNVILGLLANKVPSVDIRDNLGNTPLHLAARRGHVESIKELLSAGANQHILTENGLTPLNEACAWGQTRAAEVLMKSDQSNEALNTNFLHAAVSGSSEIARLLLDEKADKNTQNKEGETALHLAAWNSDTRLMQLLLSRRADLEICDHLHRTPLFAAVDKNIACVKMLLDAGANTNVDDDVDETPLYRACEKNSAETVRLLLKAGAPLRSGGLHSDHWFLFAAVLSFTIPVLRVLAEHVTKKSPQPDLISPRMASWILRERHEDAVDLVKIIVDMGMDPNLAIQGDRTMLHRAVEMEHHDLIHLLTQRGKYQADIDKSSKTLGTPLQIAAAKGHIDTVKRLLICQADPSKGAGRWGTPLHAAANMGGTEPEDVYNYFQIVKTLLRHSKQEELINKQAGFFGSALQAAVDSQSRLMVRVLLRYDPDLTQVSGVRGTAIHMATWKCNSSMVQFLLRTANPPLSPCTPDQEGRLPLHLAAAQDRQDLVELLSNDDGATVVTRDYQGRHALHFAAACGSIEVARAILDKHENAVDDEDCDGWTPLHWACRQEESEMVALLIARSSEKNKRTHRGWRPVDVAVYSQKGIANFGKVKKLLRTAETSAAQDQQADGTPWYRDPRLGQDPVRTAWRRQLETLQDASSSTWAVSTIAAYDEEESLPVQAADGARTAEMSSFTCDSCYCVSSSS